MPERHIRARVLKVCANPAKVAEAEMAIRVPLTEDEIRGCLDRTFGKDTVWLGMYRDLPVFHGDETLRGWLQSIPARAAIILYRWEPTYGHWNCLFIGKYGSIEFFDSLAAYPDSLQKRQSKLEAEKLGQDDRRLVRALHWQPAFYNDAPLQKPTAQTCGRWDILRLVLRHLSADQFIAFIDGLVSETGRSPDFVVAAATI